MLGFLNLGGLTTALAQIVQLRAANLTLAGNGDAVHTGRMQRERTLDAYTVRSAANSERFAARAVTACDYDAFERLKTLTVTFNNLNLYLYSVADVELGDVRAQLSILDGTDDFIHCDILLPL